MRQAHLILLFLATAALLTAARVAPAAGETWSDAAPAWSSIAAPPLRTDRSETIVGSSVAGDSADPQRVAFCVPGAIQLTTDGGATWSTISITGVAEAASGTDYPLFTDGQAEATCVSVLPAPGQPARMYTTFQAMSATFGAPPIFFVGYQTTDGGASWQAVPVPDGHSAVQFGGFQQIDGAVQALFGRPNAGGRALPGAAPVSPDIAVEQADADGSWTPASLTCPVDGPCVRFGPGPNQIGSCSMSERVQSIEYSTDGGSTFSVPDGPSLVNACSLNEIAALSSTEAVLLSGTDQIPVRVTNDGGQTWSAVALPLLPGSNAGDPIRYPGLQILPNGSLIARDQAAWQQLAPGSTAWCRAPIPFGAQPNTVVPIGDQLWWLQGGGSPSSGTFAASAPLAGLGGGC